MKQGIYHGLGMAEYHDWKLDKANLKAGPISCSMLKSFAVNPYSWLLAPEFKPTAAMKTGSLFDLAVTDPDKLADSVAISEFDNFKTKAAREWRDEQTEAGRIVVAGAELENACKAAEKVHSHPIAGEIMRDAKCQVGVIGEVNGIPAKALLDILPIEDGDWAETIVDYKTTSLGLHDDGIRKAISQFGYHKQAAFYRSLFNKISSDRICEDFAFIFQDTTTLEVRVVKLSDDAMMLGNRWIATALKEFAKCAQRGIKSNYGKTVSTVDVLPYVTAIEEEWIESTR